MRFTFYSAVATAAFIASAEAVAIESDDMDMSEELMEFAQVFADNHQ